MAYFSYENGEMMMRDAEIGEKVSIGKGSYNGNEWVGPAILATYQELVAKAAPGKVITEEKPAESPDVEKLPALKKVKKKSDKKRQSRGT